MLWEDAVMPNSKNLTVTDSIANERVYRIGNPYIEAFFPSIQENKNIAVLVIPGGGYARLAHEISGRQIAKWFNTMGISAFVLFHRLPGSSDIITSYEAPVQDAQQAMRLIRKNAAEWGIDTSKVGVMGCSAGGHLSATLSTFDKDYTGINDSLAFKPDFTMLVSPVISFEDSQWLHKGTRENLLGLKTKKYSEKEKAELINLFSLDKQVSQTTPPTILFHADNDKSVGSMNSILYYSALKQNKIPASLHIFPEGGHSIALRNNPGATQMWTEICESWIFGLFNEKK